jgi:hypothetical protein
MGRIHEARTDGQASLRTVAVAECVPDVTAAKWEMNSRCWPSGVKRGEMALLLGLRTG